jgi:hypothetical protein
MNIPHLTIKRPNGWEYWFDKDEQKICKGGFKTPLTDEEITALDTSIIITPPEPIQEEPDLEMAAYAVVTLKALATSTVIPSEYLSVLEDAATTVKDKAGVSPNLGESATFTTLKLIEKLELKGEYPTAEYLKGLLANIQHI